MLLSEITNYFLEIATKLIEIQHTPENKKYAQINIGEFLESFKVNLNTSTPFLLLDYPTSRVQDKLSDNPHEFITITFIVLQEIKTNDFAKEIEVLDLTKTIVLKILSKIYEDTKNRTFLHGFQRSTIKITPLKDYPMKNLVGHIVKFEANKNLTDELQYREADWLV